MEYSIPKDDRYVTVMSTCRHPRLRLYDHPSLFYISVTVDPLLCKIYSHIRLIIVYEETPELSDMQIDRSAVTSLERRIRRMSAKANHQAISRSSSLEGAICNVVLKLTYDFRHYESVKMSKLTPLDKFDQRMRIGYESIHPITSTSNVLYEPLANTHHQRGLWIEGDDDNWYLISILPPSHLGRSTTIQSLPPEISSAIVREALEFPKMEFDTFIARKILSYALVCKSWLHICDLYWEYIGREGHLGRAHFPFQTAGRFLEQKPYLAQYFRKLDDGRWESDIDLCSGGVDWHPNLVLFRKMVSMAGKYLTSLEISPNLLFHMFDGGPLPLRELTSFSIRIIKYPGVVPNGIDRQPGSILDLQHPLKECKRLRTLSFHPQSPNWYPPLWHNWEVVLPPCQDLFEIEPYEGPNGPPPPYNLTKIELGNVYISQRQLLYFLSGPSGPRLTELALTYVEGLTNSNLLEIFAIVRSTLRSLEITDCRIEPPAPGDELALDASIKSMSALHDVDVVSDIASMLALERKCEESGGPRKRSSISIHAIDPLHFLASGTTSLTGAIEVTLWKTIRLIWTRYTSFTEFVDIMRPAISKACRVASKRGVELFVKYD